MLKLMRDSFQHLKWILVAIVAIFILFIFVDWGAGGARGGSSDKGYAARVNGETISYAEYSRTLKNYEDTYRQMYGAQFTPELAEQMGLPRQVLESLVDQRLMVQEARRLHMGATPEEVRTKLLSIPTLNPDGRFVGMELYTNFVTGRLGYPSASAFEEDLGREITLQKMESALTSAVAVSPKAAEAEYKRASENAKIRYILYPAQREAATVQITPQEIETYYRNNQAKYTHSEQRKVRYLIADFNSLRAQIIPSDAEIRQRYDTSKEEFKSPDRAHVFHILVKVDPKATPAEDAAAKAKADALVAQLRAGGDFAKAARETSQDPGSATNGGDMGWVNKGQTVQSFEQKIFSVPLNMVDVVRSPEYGYHIVKVTERQQAGYQPFEEVRAQLAARIAEDKAKEEARQAITAVAAQIRNKKPKTADEFSAFANSKVVSNDTGWFGKNDPIPGLGSNQPLTTFVFAAKPNDAGEIMGTQRGMIIPFIEGVRPAGVTALDEIRAKVETDARTEKARVAAKDSLARAMAGAANVDAVAAKVGMTAAETSVNRQGFVSGFNGDTTGLVDAVMSANIGELKGPIVVGDGAAAFQVLEQKKVTPAELAQNRGQYLDQLRQQQARNLRTVLLQRLRKEAKIDVNEQLVKPQAQQGSQQTS